MSSSTPLTIDQLIEEIDTTPYGPEERALLAQALALAIESEDEVREFELRMRLTSSARMSGDTETMLSSFAWCIGKHDADPVRFPVELDSVPGGADLYWQYKWMASALSASPVFKVEQIRSVIDDMADRYGRAGIGMSGVLFAQFEAARLNGWTDEAAIAFEALQRTERDEYSHCDACARSSNGIYLAGVGRETEALQLFDEIVAGGFSCGSEPEHALSASLLPLLRAGRLDHAKTAHLRSYRAARENADNLGIIANHLVFCAVTANEARGLAMLERHIGWLAHDGLNHADQFEALAATGLLLDAVVVAGFGDTPVRGAELADLEPFFGAHTEEWSAAELAPVAWAAAAAIGDSFDARNGNEHRATTLARVRALADEHYDLPIHSGGLTVAVPAAVEADPVDAAGWVERVREISGSRGDTVAAAQAARSGLEIASGEERAILLSTLVGTAVADGDEIGASSALVDRIEALKAIGHIDQAALEEHLGLLVFGTATEADIPTLERELATMTSETAPATVSDLALTLGGTLLGAGRPADAVAVLRRGTDVLGDAPAHVGHFALLLLSAALHQTGDVDGARDALDRVLAMKTNRAIRAAAHRNSANLRASVGDFDAAVLDAEAAIQLDLALGARAAAVDDALLAAHILNDLDRGADAILKLRFAITQAELAESPSVLALRFSLGRQLVRIGASAEAVDLLSDVLEAEEAAGAPAGALAETLDWLGAAHRAEGDYGATWEVWDRAIEGYQAVEDESSAVDTRIALGHLLLSMGLEAQSVEVLQRAVEHVRSVPEKAAQLPDLLHLFGRAQCETGDAAGLETLDEVLQIARANDAAWLVADVSDSRARGLFRIGKAVDAVAASLAAADLYADAGDQPGAGQAVLFAARVLVAEDRQTDAVPLYRAALQHVIADPDLHAQITTELATLLSP